MKKLKGISINYLLSWIFYVQNAIKFVNSGKNNFEEIIVEENMENSFLFKMKKKKENNKSIGYLFGLFETYKDECFITEYSLQETSLEQIFNEFAVKQDSILIEEKSTEILPDDIENIVVKDDTTRKSVRFQKFILTDELVNIILGNN